MARLGIYLLGPCYATLDKRPVTFVYDKVRALLAYLVTEGESAMDRERLATFFWPELTQQAAQTGLRQALAKLRRALGDQQAGVPFLRIQRDSIQFNSDSDALVDVLAFRQRLADCASHHHRSLATCPTCTRLQDEACSLYRGNFLEQLSVPDSAEFEEWAAYNLSFA